MADRPYRIKFQVSIVTLVSALVSGLAAGLIWLAFDRTAAIVQSAAQSYIEQVAERTSEKVRGQFEPVLSTLHTLAALPQMQAPEARFDPSVLALLGGFVREVSQVYGAFVGYDDGDVIAYTEIGQLKPPDLARLGAPPGSVYESWELHHADDGSRFREAVFYDRELRELGRRAAPERGFDPRTRPWYVGAFEPDAKTVTRPYIFFEPKVTGYTVRVPVAGPVRGVLAADLLLTEVSAFLDRQKIGKTGQVILFSDDNEVVAHPALRQLEEATGSELRIPHVDQLGVPEYGEAIAAWRSRGESVSGFRIGGRDYLVAFRDIDVNFSSPMANGMNLMIVAPLDEFFEEIIAVRRELVVLALLLAGAAIPLVWWLGRTLSHKLRALAAETDRIQSFAIAESPPIRSRILEIDELGRSVDTMKTVVRTFSSFVPRRLVQELIQSGTPLALGGARREVTLLFTDIRNFTPLAEQSEAEQLMLYTSRYLAAMSDTVMEHHGTVDKFVGDSVMAFWNAPAEHPDHVAQACAAVLACRDRNQALNDRFTAEGWHALGTRYGLHVGEAIVGNIGSAERMNYTVIGAAVNLAARLEGLNGAYGTDVLVSGAVEARVRDRFFFRAVDTVQPKGIRTPVPVFELRGARDGTPAAEREAGFCAAWEVAYDLYLGRDWEAALAAFEAFAARHPEDPLARIYVKRAADYALDPPDAEWTAVAVFKTK